MASLHLVLYHHDARTFCVTSLSTMAKTLPLELLEAIVDNVAIDRTPATIRDLLSLCLCSKALVPRAQTYLYSDVTIHLVNDRLYNIPDVRLRRTRTLMEALRTKPHLKSHTRTLRCKRS